MNRKGFLFIEVIMGLFLLGIIAVTCLPLLNTATNNMNLAKKKIDMVFIAESTLEQIKSFDYAWPDDQCLFDIKMKDLIYEFNDSNSVTINLPQDVENNDLEYLCTIYKYNIDEKLWEVHIEISSKEEKEKIKDVSMFAIIPVPREGD